MPLDKHLPPTHPTGEPLAALFQPLAPEDARFLLWAKRVGRLHGARTRTPVRVGFAPIRGWDEGAIVENPLTLQIPVQTDIPECVFLHELGHLLQRDHLTDPAAVRALADAARNAPSLADSVAYVAVHPEATRERHLLTDAELFARLYSQVVAERLRPPLVRMQIARRMTQCREEGAFPLFWERDELIPLARGLQDLLIAEGLMALGPSP